MSAPRFKQAGRPPRKVAELNRKLRANDPQSQPIEKRLVLNGPSWPTAAV